MMQHSHTQIAVLVSPASDNLTLRNYRFGFSLISNGFGAERKYNEYEEIFLEYFERNVFSKYHRFSDSTYQLPYLVGM
mgnify:CR=1 FL=1